MSTQHAATRNEVVMNHYALVRRIARQIHSRLPQSVDVDDLVSVGVIGLMESMSRYNPSRGVPFDTYARHRIRGSILDALRAVDWVPHSVRRKAQAIERARRTLQTPNGDAPTADAIADRLGLDVENYRSMLKDAEIRVVLSMDAPASADAPTLLSEQIPSECDVEAQSSDDQRRTLVIEAIDKLPEREATAIRLYYLRQLPLKEVGRTLGVTESRACQLCGQGIKRLRRRLAHAC